MRWTAAVAALLMPFLSNASLAADGLPQCRVRVVKSAKADALSRELAKEVEGWVGLHAAGCVLVPSIQEADLLLELHDSRFKVQGDGMPVQEWWFVVRNLREAVPDRALHRFILAEPWPTSAGRRDLSRRLGVVLNDVCLGLSPSRPSSGDDRR